MLLRLVFRNKRQANAVMGLFLSSLVHYFLEVTKSCLHLVPISIIQSKFVYKVPIVH
jgi:hypothetical protein